jgi:exodeoxyribonuclease V gamma subunit
VARALQMASGRFSAPELEVLCRLDPVALRYRFSANEQTSLVDLIRSAGFRWGFDAQHRRQFLAGEFAEYSLDEALDRVGFMRLKKVEARVAAIVAEKTDTADEFETHRGP